MDGFNGTIFAYGQTSSGKTFTMQGVLNNLELEGITPRIIKSIFDHTANSGEEHQYIVKISLLEIYNEKIKVKKRFLCKNFLGFIRTGKDKFTNSRR